MRILLAERILGGDIAVSWIAKLLRTLRSFTSSVIVTERLAMSGIEYSLHSTFDWNPFRL